MAKSLLPAVVLLVAFLGSTLSFVGLRSAPRQESRIALRGQAGASATPWTPVLSRDVVEIEFTAPAQGARCRFMIKADADASEVLAEGRKRLGFNQEWMPDSDFKIYNSEDEEAGPLKGKMKDNGLIDFTYEVWTLLVSSVVHILRRDFHKWFFRTLIPKRAPSRAETLLMRWVLLVAFLGSTLSFVNLCGRQAPRQESRTALRGQAGASATPWTPVLSRDVVEIEFTAPAQGARCRFMIKADADASEVLAEGRKRLGFNQEWMPDSDFKIYNSEDEEAGPLKGKMKDNGLIDFTYEVHLYYEPQ
ncbi:Etfdh [Symbiodinium microadriaticum]|nr:Etfdh [Symbiodinium microadriaticum]